MHSSCASVAQKRPYLLQPGIKEVDDRLHVPYASAVLVIDLVNNGLAQNLQPFVAIPPGKSSCHLGSTGHGDPYPCLGDRSYVMTSPSLLSPRGRSTGQPVGLSLVPHGLHLTYSRSCCSKALLLQAKTINPTPQVRFVLAGALPRYGGCRCPKGRSSRAVARESRLCLRAPMRPPCWRQWKERLQALCRVGHANFPKIQTVLAKNDFELSAQAALSPDSAATSVGITDSSTRSLLGLG